MKASRTPAAIAARGIVALTLAMACTVATAAVTFNPANGTGHVDKADMQAAFGWNANELNAFARGVTFSVEATTHYQTVCTWTNNNGKIQTRTQNTSHTSAVNVNSKTNHHERRDPLNRLVNGFYFTGMGSSFTTTGSVPALGSGCPGTNGHQGIYTSVTPTPGVSGLFANYGVTKVRIAE